MSEDKTKPSNAGVGDQVPHGQHDTPTDGQEINFPSFIMSLATQGMMQLGEMPAPSGVEVPVDLSDAKQTIDILSILQEKTKGNLDTFEEGLIHEVLHNLRMAFVRKSKG